MEHPFKTEVLQILSLLERYCPTYLHFAVAKVYLQATPIDWDDVATEFHAIVRSSPDVQEAIADHDALAILESGCLELVFGTGAVPILADLTDIWGTLTLKQRSTLFHRVKNLTE